MTPAQAFDKTMDYLRGTKREYRQIPLAVLRDLERFCRASESTVIPGNPDLSLMLAGRREVWLRIQEFRNFTPEQLYQIKTGGALAPTGDSTQ